MVLATGLIVASTAVPAAAAPTRPQPAAPVKPAAASTPVTGNFTDALGGTGTLTGTFVPTKFVASGQQILAEGTLTAGLVDSAGTTVGNVTQAVTLPVANPSGGGIGIQATCQILDLVLGPLDLNLLGLVVHLDTVHLNITAESGPGNLVGNLLCAIAGLLNGVPNPQTLVLLLNVILALLSL